MSDRIMAIFAQYDPNMLPAGCDEGYLKYFLSLSFFMSILGNGSIDSITKYCNEHDLTPDQCVEEMRKKVFEQTQLTVSAGIAPNKVSNSHWPAVCDVFDRNLSDACQGR